MKDPSVKVNKNWGHNKPIISQKPGEYAYMSPLIRDLCVRCKDLNVQLMNLLQSINGDSNEAKNLAILNNRYPDILQRVVYDQDIYADLINMLPALCEHYNINGECDEKGCPFNPSKEE